MDSTGPLWYIALICLIGLSAFFSSSETAISTVSRLRLKKQAEEGSKKAKVALSIIDHYDKALFTILIGNNIVNIAASAIATVIATSLLGAAGPLVATVVMTALVLTFGEILPKSYSKDNSEKISLQAARPLRAVIGLLSPLTWIFMRFKDRVIAPVEKGPSVTEEELHYFLESIEEEGIIEEQERDLVQSALEFDEIAIKEIVTPRVDVVALDIEDPPEEIRETILEEGYSRIPVYEENIDNIIGILPAREYLRCLIRGEEVDLRAMLMPPVFVHRSMKLSQLLAYLKSKKVNLAVVTDDYGGTLGIVTIEDVVEELVGDLWDEDDEEAEGFIRHDENRCEVLGAYPLRDMLEEQDWEQYEVDSDYSTVNGWAMHIFGHIPAEGETVLHKDLRLTVLEMDGHRIKRLEITRVEEEPKKPAADKRDREEQE